MALGARLRAGVVRLTARRYRRILIASATTLATSALLLGLISFIRWRGHQALQGDTLSVSAQASQQLIRTLQSRRGTLTFIRDTLKRRADLTEAQLQAMGASAVEHTRHLIGTGLIQSGEQPDWWVRPRAASGSELALVTRAMLQRTQLRGAWTVPSTFVVMTDSEHPFLVMIEPLRSAAMPESAIAGVFDLRPLLTDFFAANLPAHTPVQMVDGDTLLFRSNGWVPGSSDHRPIVESQPVALDAARWTLQMQPGRSRVAQTLSWVNVLLMGLSAVAGLGIIAIVWILAARTWILQRAVTRRTAALRRASERLRQMAVTDELTGLHNRRFFLSRWEWECERAKRYRRPLACLLIDVNNFKSVNDHLGHQAGDRVLQGVARELKALLRQSDILARFGGDEFIIALPETGDAQAESVAEKLRHIRIPVLDGEHRSVPDVSLSVGVSRVEQDDESPEAIIEAADQSLYSWKQRLKIVPH